MKLGLLVREAGLSHVLRLAHVLLLPILLSCPVLRLAHVLRLWRVLGCKVLWMYAVLLGRTRSRSSPCCG